MLKLTSVSYLKMRSAENVLDMSTRCPTVGMGLYPHLLADMQSSLDPL